MKALFALNPYIWKYKKHLFLGIVFVVISNIFTVYPAQIVRNALNMVEEVVLHYQLFANTTLTGQLDSMLSRSLLLFAGLVVLMALLRGAFLFFTRQTLIVMSRLVEYDLRNDLYQHFQEMSLSFYRRNRTGDLMARLTEDVSRVRMYLGPGIMYTINTISLAIVVVTTMLMVNPELTFYTLLPLPILSYLIYYVESIIQNRSERIQRQLSRLTTFAQEIFSGIRVVKAYVKEEESAQKFEEESEVYKQKSLHLARVDAIFYPLVVMLVGLSTILAVWIGGESVIAGRLSIGNIAEFIIYINILTWPIVAIGWVTTLIQRAAASQVRLNELLAQRNEIKFPPASPPVQQAGLVFEEVSFTYPDTGIAAIQELSFELRPGQKLGIVGPTGSGKSTLCALIPRLFQIDSGEIRLGGRRLETYARLPLRQAIGYAPQDVFLFSDTIHNNIAFGLPQASRQQVEEAAALAAIKDSIMEFPLQFDTRVGERGVTLSGGQKQRISIARAWIRQPNILILDDVLSAVDTKTEETILQNLRTYRQQHQNAIVLMVAHRISCIQDADLIIVLENGRLTQRGTHEELIQQNGYYSRIYEKQLLEESSTA
ncbi:MAG: ABC transporter ATP-binding protein [Bacteroidetes bacterium]|nr:MAG: ABC transporter ATP-binding protein [Bacteroidota bacterium]